MNNGKLPLVSYSDVQARQSYHHTISTESETDDETNETTRLSKGDMYRTFMWQHQYISNNTAIQININEVCVCNL